MNHLSFLVEDYFHSREHFRALADKLGWGRESHPIQARGPRGEELTIDAAWSSERRELPTFVLSSGLHGAEGFFGADVQLSRMRQLLEAPGNQLNDVRWLLIHALNPFGFSHVRRADAENIDPNRNFLLPGETFTASPPGYAELDPLLNPKTPMGDRDWFYTRAAWMVLRMGMPKLKQAIATGQYDFPDGLFFGGDGPCETQQILAQHLPRWVAGAPRVVHFDLHTGLGKWGTGKLLIDSQLTPSQQAWLQKHLGAESYEANDSRGVAYVARGGFGPWCVHNSGVPDYLFACAEFGTFPPLKVLAGLRAENREHHFGSPDSPGYARAKAGLQQLFYPDTRAFVQAFDWIEAAIRGLKPPV